MGCHLNVDDYNIDDIKVTGYTCKRGLEYGKTEVLHPLRMVTSSVNVLNGEYAVVSCKTQSGIPKELIFECLEVLKNVEVKAPVKIGDILVENILSTGVNVIATRNVEAI